jgi:hypothetical protein
LALQTELIFAIFCPARLLFSKKMGQNFLVNPSFCPRMAKESDAEPGTAYLR